MTGNDLFLRFLVTLPLLLLSLVVHELAHGWVAWKLGDPTAKLHGRLTLNPLRQLDVWGTVALVVTFVGSGGSFFFGWAKPVPISPWHFKDPQRGMMLVGAAGPAANFALALVAAGLVWLTYTWSLFAAQALALAFLLNVVLGVINLIPVPPLDGSRVVGGFLPRDAVPALGRSRPLRELRLHGTSRSHAGGAAGLPVHDRQGARLGVSAAAGRLST